eukprot:CAMPEP_0172308416 /NCGR_PEP_ID=MMETSP1058-20130122/9017_1 /TAXON_ID=83371 /ORGANISM="Detonula confervacea, Strain CCMP 353" /LENGTH=179 /DNA_ID=CAMNT_0013020825 /DNA_START=42 /DNA_END=581 /DNA_ORIENTATION=-
MKSGRRSSASPWPKRRRHRQPIGVGVGTRNDGRCHGNNRISQRDGTMELSAKAMLETAKTMTEMAKNTSENAWKNEEAAQLQLASSQKEVVEAEKFLEGAEKRWEVIDVDSNVEEGGNMSGKKQTRGMTVGVIDVDAEIAASLLGSGIGGIDIDVYETEAVLRARAVALRLLNILQNSE